ncbi:hypothetical protein NUW58_g10246 [Xylaria curta]|uniref:Uncharacterized protein n=1 Tax=Xylaria curta TaxID=42375 RepID=A0ACC1MNT2_9PEZI|nr:hypothetical protein NUW58_g10246 [Xylaria curta]
MESLSFEWADFCASKLQSNVRILATSEQAPSSGPREARDVFLAKTAAFFAVDGTFAQIAGHNSLFGIPGMVLYNIRRKCLGILFTLYWSLVDNQSSLAESAADVRCICFPGGTASHHISKQSSASSGSGCTAQTHRHSIVVAPIGQILRSVTFPLSYQNRADIALVRKAADTPPTAERRSTNDVGPITYGLGIFRRPIEMRPTRTTVTEE